MKTAILNHFGFTHIPFGKDIDAKHLFPTAGATDAIAMLELGIELEDIIVLTGPIGCGKSLVLRAATHRFDATKFQVIYLRGTISSAAELFKLILQGLKVDPPYSITQAKPAFYEAVAAAKRTPVVVIDDAQDTATEALLMLKAMTNFDADSTHRISFILAGQPELAAILQYSHFDALRARIRLSNTLSPMTLAETIGYIDHGLKTVACTNSVFTESAKKDIHSRTGGIARSINSLCYRAILQAVITKSFTIDTTDLPQAVP